MNRISAFIFALLCAVVGAGLFAGWHFRKIVGQTSESDDPRTNRVVSVNEPSLFETAPRTNPVDSSNEPYSFVPEGEVVEPAKTLATPDRDVWTTAMLNLTSATAHLRAVETMVAPQNTMLPEAETISGKFSEFNRELDALTSSSHLLTDGQRVRIRESLNGSIHPMISRIHDALKSRAENHLVHLMQSELAVVMESVQGL